MIGKVLTSCARAAGVAALMAVLLAVDLFLAATRERA